MSTITMGAKVEALKDGNWIPGTVLGVHDNAFDVLYEGGEGDMMKPSTEVRGIADAGVEVSEPKKKPTSIGWNASAFADECGAVIEESEVATVKTPTPTPVPVSVSVKKTFSPMINDKVECKDFITKEYRTARIINIDVELKTYDVRFEDGVDAKGVPGGLLRERLKKKRGGKVGKKRESCKENNNSVGNQGSDGVNEIVGLCEGLNEKQLAFVKNMIRGVKEL